MSAMNIASEGGFKFKEPPSDILSTLNSFRNNRQFCDVELEVGNRQFYAHKIVLAASSEYFKVFFSSNFQEAHQPVIPLDTISANVMEIIIDFAYSNMIEITTSNVLAVMLAANFLQVESLVIACCNYLEENICADICFGVWRLHSMYSDRFQHLGKKAQDFIVANFPSASQTQDFLELEPDDLISIIKNDALNVNTEDFVFEAVVRWLCFDRERFSILDKVLSHVRLAFVDPTVLQDWAESMNLFNSPLCMKLVEEARKYHLLHPSRRADVLSKIRIRRFSAQDSEALVIHNRDGDEKSLMCINRKGDIVKNIKYPPEKTRTMAVSSYNKVILAGTWEKIFEYNFETNTWVLIKSNLKPRYFFGLCELDGYWYSIGGDYVGGRVSDVLEKYDPGSKEWKQLTSMRTAVSYPAVLSHKGFIFVLGGRLGERKGCDKVQRYDPRRRSWTILTNMPVPVQYPAACVLDGMIYVFNFSRESNEEGRRVLVYNVSTDKWDLGKDIVRPFLGGPAIMEGSIYVLSNDIGNDSSIMCYSPSADSWVLLGKIKDFKSKLMCGPIVL